MLTRLSAKSLENQLSTLSTVLTKNIAPKEKCSLRIARRTPDEYWNIVSTKVKDGVLYICPAPSFIAKMSSLITQGTSELVDIKKLAEVLQKDKTISEVVVGWPESKSLSGVTAVYVIQRVDECFIYLFTCPLDIDKVNEEIREYVRANGCPHPELDDCEDCELLLKCELLDKAGEASRQKREGQTKWER